MTTLPEVIPSEAFELASFETPVVTTTVPNVRWSIEKHLVAQDLAIAGINKTQISKNRKVPVPTINKWLENGEFRDYVNQIVMEAAGTAKALLISLDLKILNARIAAAEESGDYGRLSGKDTLDIADNLRKLTGADESKEDSGYASIMKKILGITENKPIEVTAT